MIYVLPKAHKDALQKLYEDIRKPDSGFYNEYWRAYKLIGDAITSPDGSGPMASVEASTLLWFRGAEQVNAGVGIFSTFIRTYTAEQYRLRTGQNISPAGADRRDLIQVASDSIADEVIIDVLLNGILPLRDLGERDAGNIVGTLYGARALPANPRHNAGTTR